MKEVAWAKLLSCCAMVFALLKNMSYKDIKITTLPKAPMTKSSLLRSFACIMRSPLFDFWRYEPKPSTLSQVFKAILLKSEAVGAAGEDACAQDGHENVRSAVLGAVLPNSMSPTWQKHRHWCRTVGPLGSGERLRN